jgi:anti-sigma B factor antagonist
MKIDKNVNGETLTLTLDGRLDTTTAPQLEAEIKNSLNGLANLIMDFGALDYLSSAGLRVLLATQKQINAKKSKMVIKNVNSTIMEVFEITGFTAILTIEQSQ